MVRSIQWRIIVLFVMVIILTLGGLGIYLVKTVRDSQINGLRSRLENEARITAQASVSDFLSQTPATTLDGLAKQIGGSIGGRITFIATDGTVLGDTELDPATMGNYADRPEVKEALARNIGQNTRDSSNGRQAMYVAVSVLNQNKVIGVVRASQPLSVIDSLDNRVRNGIILATILAMFLSGLAAWIIGSRAFKPVREVTAASLRISQGHQPGETIALEASGEAGDLARAFNQMSLKLKEMLDVISEDRARLAGILENMADGVIVTDDGENIAVINRAARRLFRITSEKPQGHVIEMVRDHEVTELIKLCLETKREQTSQFETIGTNKFLRAVALPLHGGQTRGVLLLLQDLTELREVQTMRKELIGNISHEFRTPLAGIKAMAETLRDGALDDKDMAGDFLGRIDNEVDRLTQLVSELTELSRIETGRAELDRAPVDINLLVNDIQAQLLPQVVRKDISLLTELEPELPSVKADRERIRQVVINLLHNAIKFTDNHGSITIKTLSQDGSVVVRITDTGIGIPDKDLPRIFERFYKADKARSGMGTGLGLAIARHIVEAHNGKVWVESREGQGSTFSFSLPIED